MLESQTVVLQERRLRSDLLQRYTLGLWDKASQLERVGGVIVERQGAASAERKRMLTDWCDEDGWYFGVDKRTTGGQLKELVREGQ